VIYTSYFAKAKNHPRVLSGELRPMSIAANRPSCWPDVEECFSFKPYPNLPSALKKGDITPPVYASTYRRQNLDCISRYVIDRLIEAIDNTVLLCYETPEKFCHRKIVARWLLERGRVVVHELDYDGRLPVFEDDQHVNTEPVQLSLFQ